MIAVIEKGASLANGVMDNFAGENRVSQFERRSDSVDSGRIAAIPAISWFTLMSRPREDIDTAWGENFRVRILILSDIHANLEALEASLEAAPEHERVFNLGDIVGYGASPNEVTERSRALDTVFVRGNHDRASTGLIPLDDFNPVAGLAVRWTREHLTPENSGFLRALPQGPVAPVAALQCVHGSPRDEDEYVLSSRDAWSMLAQAPVPLIFFGHTHVQGAYWIDDVVDKEGVVDPRYASRRGKQQFTLPLKETGKYLVNPGSIGQPRDGDARAAFALLDTEAKTVDFHRVPYDLERAQKKILSAGLPDRLASRLAEGR